MNRNVLSLLFDSLSNSVFSIKTLSSSWIVVDRQKYVFVGPTWVEMSALLLTYSLNYLANKPLQLLALKFLNERQIYQYFSACFSLATRQWKHLVGFVSAGVDT